MNMAMPTYETHSDVKKFFYEGTDDDGLAVKRMSQLRKSCVVVSVPCLNGTVSKVAFMKTSRSKTYRDSRERTKRLNEREVFDELNRLLRDPAEAYNAFRSLNV